MTVLRYKSNYVLNTFVKRSPSNLLIISYKLNKIQVPSSNSFRDILLTILKCPNFQMAIIPEKKLFKKKDIKCLLFPFSFYPFPYSFPFSFPFSLFISFFHYFSLFLIHFLFPFSLFLIHFLFPY